MNPEHLGGAFLKPGIIKRNLDGTHQRVRCTISARNGGPRILPERQNDHGKFGPALEIPVVMDSEGQDFVLSIPADKGDGKVLRAVFGPDLASWAGKAVDVYESPILDRMRVVVPIG